MGRHKGVWVEVGKMKAEIDELLAPLIKLMWENFIETEECCQGEPDEVAEDDSNEWPVIFFSEECELRKFLNLVATHIDDRYENPLYRRMAGIGNAEKSWRYSIKPEDWHICENEKICDFRFATYVCFPQSDIPEIIKALSLSRFAMENALRKLNIKT